ncbi:MAG TPA: redox-sensing transcriptional repressor Rex [Blastocatellia bacterium]|nr:redox-sensing transcriptional repressor Rex [Blastocatellia bacterium]
MKTEKISELTTSRLSLYLRCLDELASEGVERISSKAMAEQFALNSAQIRKDLAYFGEFGVRGVGYSVSELRRQLREILGLNTEHNVAIVGAGNLGIALATYGGFNVNGFRMVAIFDSDPKKIGKETRDGLPIQDVRELSAVIQREKIEIVVFAIPAAAAEKLLDEVTAAGVKAVLNFAPVRLQPKPGVKIKHVDFAISLESLSYFLAQPHSSGQPTTGMGADFRDLLRNGK